MTDLELSVIVPVHDRPEDLAACLASMADLTTPHEVLVVVLGGPGATLEVAEDAARENRNIRVIAEAATLDPGPARNLALGEATGRWVAFVDSDDVIEAGVVDQLLTLPVVAGGSVDLLVFDHEVWDPEGERTPNPRRAVLRHLSGRTTTLLEAPELLDLIPATWNKLYRRAFLEREDARFGPGIYEDMPWSYRLLALAEPVAVSDQVAYRYRRGSSHESLLAKAGREHEAVLSQWDALTASLDEDPRLSDVAGLVHERMLQHAWYVLESNRLAPSSINAVATGIVRRTRALRLRGTRLGRVRASVLRTGRPVLVRGVAALVRPVRQWRAGRRVR